MKFDQETALTNILVGLLSTDPSSTPIKLADKRTVIALTPNLTEKSRYQLVYRILRKLKGTTRPPEPKIKTSLYNVGSVNTEIVGIIADTHEPFCLPEYLPFCESTFKSHGVTRIIHIGDEVDNYYMSFHAKDPNYLDVVGELENAKTNMKKWYEVFPNTDVMIGNHTALPFRQAANVGIPDWFLKPHSEAWQAPKGWKWHDSLVIDNVKYTHGVGSSGQNGAMNRALRSRQSTVIGHLHAWAGVHYHASDNDLIFGMNVGWGADHQRYAFAYGKDYVNKPVVGCGVVKSGKEAIFVPMDLGSKYIYTNGR